VRGALTVGGGTVGFGGIVAVRLGDDDLVRLQGWIEGRSVHARWTVHGEGTSLVLADEDEEPVAVLWIAAWQGSLGLVSADLLGILPEDLILKGLLVS